MAAIGRINFDARKLGAVGDQGAMKVLIKKGFQLANDIKLSMKDSGPAGKRGATREDRAAKRSKMANGLNVGWSIRAIMAGLLNMALAIESMVLLHPCKAGPNTLRSE